VAYASGDSNRTDGVRETFGEGFLSGHDKLGLSDLVGWRNVRHARVGLEVRPRSTWQCRSQQATPDSNALVRSVDDEGVGSFARLAADSQSAANLLIMKS
jgi:hypothetical protein